VTYSQFEALNECALKGVTKVLILDGPLPEQIPTRASLVGRFHHKALELAATVATADELQKRIEQEISLLQEAVSRWPHLRRLGSVSGWDDVNRSASLAERVAANRSGDIRARRGIERELRSRNGALIGRPDYFSISGVAARLREYKTGAIRDSDGEPLVRYVRQLQFYSQLLVDNYGVQEISGSVESLNGDAFERVIGVEEAAEFSNHVLTTIATVNAELRDAPALGGFAHPAPDACECCDAQVICSVFKASDSLQTAGFEQFFVEGTVADVEAVTAASAKLVTIADDNRSTAVRISVPIDAARGVVAGRRFAFQYLRRHGGQLRWGAASRVFSCD
jgi:hypothetical protein